MEQGELFHIELKLVSLGHQYIHSVERRFAGSGSDIMICSKVFLWFSLSPWIPTDHTPQNADSSLILCSYAANRVVYMFLEEHCFFF